METLSWGGILLRLAWQLAPVWIGLAAILAATRLSRHYTGLYGRLIETPVGAVGLGLVLFWVLVGVLGGPFDLLVTHDPLSQVPGMKNAPPGTPLTGADPTMYPHFLLGGDNLARDVFSRLVKGAWIVIQIAPLATFFAFMVGIMLGLPAGYLGGRTDTALSFVANLVLSFPVILLFYLLVTPEIIRSGLPNALALILFAFPLLFFFVLLNVRYSTRPALRNGLLAATGPLLCWLYLSLVSSDGALIETPDFRVPGLPDALDPFDIAPGVLVVFVAVVFVNAPTVFRIARGLAMDLRSRDYVAAARTRGEGVWYIMLWEILPNTRGPLIVDFCLRIGYTTILLGTLGFFGLGLAPESPDWGSTINAGRRLLSLYPHAAIAPAVALLTLVLGLNLLADALREESMRE